jgi:hypothetical protein
MWIKRLTNKLTKLATKHMKRITAVFTGFIGGMAPLIITVAHQLFEQAPGLPQKNVAQMILGMLLFASAGAFVVFAVGELELLKAFIQGIGAPAMIAVTLQQAEVQANKAPTPANLNPPAKVEILPGTAPGAANHSDGGWNLLPQAYAQGPSPTSASIPNRVLEVKTRGDIRDVTIDFVDSNGQSVGQTTVPDAFARIVIPPRAIKVVFSKDASVASPAELPTQPGGVVYYEVIGTQGRKEFNLFSSITGKGDILYKLDVQKIEINVLKPGAEGWAFVGRRSNGDWTAIYLDFDETHPEPNKEYTVQYYVTVLDKPREKASRLGRLTKGQKVLVKEFRGYNSSPSESNQFTKDGDYYAHVSVVSSP